MGILPVRHDSRITLLGTSVGPLGYLDVRGAVVEMSEAGASIKEALRS
jgi:hypothetical protein